MKLLLAFLLSGILLYGCGSTNPSAEKANRYFDLENYFQQEIRRLDSLQPEIEKTVSNNQEEETRTLKQLDWETELKLFSNSDINKPAWRESYTVDSSVHRLSYQTSDPDLRIRSLLISKNSSGKVTGILIQREVNNYLYNSSETLGYYPDSLYHVVRRQKVKILGEDHFEVRGKFR